MKKFVTSSILAACMACALVGCSGQEEKDNTLVIYSPNSEGLIEAVIPAFEEETGIKVELQQVGTGESIKKLEAEKDDPVADVMFGGQNSHYLTNKDLFEEYVGENDDLVIEEYQNKSGIASSYTLDGSCLIVNTNLIGDIKVESYEDLLNPELKGKIATADPSNSSSAFAQLTNILLAKGGYESDEAWKFVEDLFKNIDGKVLSSSSSVYKSVADGEMVVGLSYEDLCVTLEKDGAPVNVVYPSEGTVYLPANAGIIKNAKHMDNAKKFIDYLQSQDCQDNLGLTTTNRPVLKDVQIGDIMKPISEIKTLKEDSEYVIAHKDDIVDHYKEIYTSISSEK
ncbi:extracellular solute-binding protein [Faecalicoccus sp. LCP19S3_E2]|uniref:extracellular solute-binding protein n=1 Tax=Faecalicoccus sp. LCP19S3_E2 TaxID=3438778 RepID=UPI0025EFEA5E|nr:extracellular solute-binding protein [uncultured Faecalicoccus sp.]